MIVSQHFILSVSLDIRQELVQYGVERFQWCRRKGLSMKGNRCFLLSHVFHKKWYMDRYTMCLHVVVFPDICQYRFIHSHCLVVVVSVLCIVFNSSFGGFLRTKHCSNVRLLLAENFTLTWATDDPCRQKYSSHQARKMGPKAVRGPLSNWYGAYRMVLSQAFFLNSDSGICGISLHCKKKR